MIQARLKVKKRIFGEWETEINNDLVYYFDENMNELGYTSVLDGHKKMNTSTAGRIWHQSILNEYELTQ